MKKFLLLLLFIPLLSFGKMMDKKVARIAKKNIEIFLNDDFNNNNSFLVSVDKGNRKVEDKSQGIGNQLAKSLSIMGAKVVNDGNGNVIKMSIKWAALDELKRLSATIFDSNSNSVVGSIEYNGPYIPTESKKRKGNSVSSNQKENPVEKPPQIQNNKKKAIDDLKELKELLDLELITQDEFDKKSKELKKIILGNI